MIYVLECTDCFRLCEVNCSLKEHETVVKPGFSCTCGGTFQQILVNTGISFSREGFPKKDPRWEHIAWDTPPVRDKSHLKDLCQEHNSVSRYLEDAC